MYDFVYVDYTPEFAVFLKGIECYGTREDSYEAAYRAGQQWGYGDYLEDGTAYVLEVD